MTGTGLAFIPADERKYKRWLVRYLDLRDFVEHPEEYSAQAVPLRSDENQKLNEQMDAYVLKHNRLPANVTRWNDPAPDAALLRPKVTETWDPVPDFDWSVLNGIYAKIAQLVTQGTTMQPQFAFAIAKNIVGAKMAGKVKFEDLDEEPRFYTALIGETGSGKGEAWRRVKEFIDNDHQSRLKIINSADSGAGIRDVFLEAPDGTNVLMYIDEIESFGNKGAATRNPAIIDMMIELADSTSLSSVKAAKGKSKVGKTKNDCRLSVVMCGQDGATYMKAFAGRTRLGLWDRLVPEYGVAVEAGSLPPISRDEAFRVLVELNQLDYSGTMTMAPDAKEILSTFWSSQSADVRKKARWRKHLTLDAYMSAFGRGIKVVEVSDVEIAIKIFTRQLIIRQVHFTDEVPDRTGYYLGLIKKITEKMVVQIQAGANPNLVAKSRRDFEKETHAHRDHENHLFERAWNTYAPHWLAKVQVQKRNGIFEKYIPKPEDNE